MENRNIFNKHQKELLNELSKNYNVYAIIDKYDLLGAEVYVANEFSYAIHPNIPFHTLIGFKNITCLINKNSTYIHSDNSLKIVSTEIDLMQQITQQRKFDGNAFYWLKF